MKKYTIKREMPLHLMMLPASLILLIFTYLPMGGLVMAFQDYNIGKGILHSKFTGLQNFKYLLLLPDTKQVVFNTLFISMMKIVLLIIVPLVFALLLNELSKAWYKKAVQTITYLPYLISWVVLSGIFLDFFSPTDGVVNQLLVGMGFNPIYFFGNAKLFPYMMAITDLWKNIGFNTIILLAALTGIDPGLYEAAIVDGAGRWKQTLHVTLPGVATMVVLLAVLGMGNILNAGFDQIFNLYSPVVYSTGDVIDTAVYRMGLVQMQYSLATAMGLFKSVVSILMILITNALAKKYTSSSIF
ncbi:MAG TPA: ABC transporter permease subunit [Ruminiclostridium sp.]|nr:ABC transporter permease subunit [Ruminiclostridium sp.]